MATLIYSNESPSGANYEILKIKINQYLNINIDRKMSSFTNFGGSGTMGVHFRGMYTTVYKGTQGK